MNQTHAALRRGKERTRMERGAHWRNGASWSRELCNDRLPLASRRNSLGLCGLLDVHDSLPSRTPLQHGPPPAFVRKPSGVCDWTRWLGASSSFISLSLGREPIILYRRTVRHGPAEWLALVGEARCGPRIVDEVFARSVCSLSLSP